MNLFTTLLNAAATSIVGGLVSDEFGPEAGYIARKLTGEALNGIESYDNSDDTYDFDLDLDLD
ncbi:MAG: hypothetical protein AB4080_14135 [Trichodesmium sp.]